MPLCGPPPNPYKGDAVSFKGQPRNTALIDASKLQKLVELQNTCETFLEEKLCVKKYVSAADAVRTCIRSPCIENTEVAFLQTITCAQTISTYLSLKDQLFCAILATLDGISCMTPFSQDQFINAQKFANANIENSMHVVCLLAKLLFKFNQYVIQIQPANDIASYKRFANQIMNDKERKYSQELVEKAQQSNIGDMKRLKDVEVQYDVTGIFPVFQTAGQFWNFQYDEFFKPTVYRYQLQTDQKFLQMRVEILIAAAQFFLFKAAEPEAATIAMLTAHQFLNKMENEVLNAAGAAMSAKQFAGVLDKKYPYDFTEFVIEIKKNKQCVDAFKSIIAVTKDSRTKELKELSK
ncbi:Hypothetical_protein [Hexamita inflata]|uniref:Hypothetical_protein n=1 Tax=Hexamita inflata TaxID=28002 RepID=A0ABP1HH19_9EUKA